ncbi:PREDICTED: homocysteine S-methyltransferase-like [Dinoponera quadriceps]|uniref:Homocysteine S-methyltransferase-like n=1 Tax=Dinoponera quadriceps TaxID=609295 RepID=A0A6P3WXK7_DINQU|nr:PREDICTED: homocysteine S-methyltransferase-like [Dinoponera quadriceps]
MGQPTVIDGDFETELRHHLHHFIWNKRDVGYFPLHALKFAPSAVHDTHLAFLRAGARIIRTNTFQASLDEAKKFYNLDLSEYTALIHKAVKLAREAVENYGKEMGYNLNSEEYKRSRPLIAGVCGSHVILTSLTSPNVNNPRRMVKRKEELIKFHESRVKILLTANVDLLAFQCICTLEETKAVLDILKRYSQVRAWISFFCKEHGKLNDGIEFGEVAALCHNSLPKQIIAIGVDSLQPEPIIPFMRIASEFRTPKIPFLLQACKRHIYTMRIYTDNELSMMMPLDDIKEWFKFGLSYIGGGPYTDAEDIKQICKHVENFYVSSVQDSPQPFTSFKPQSYKNNKALAKL